MTHTITKRSKLSQFGDLVDPTDARMFELQQRYTALFVFGTKAQDINPNLSADCAARLGATAFLAAPKWVADINFDEYERYDVLVTEYMKTFLKGHSG